MWHPLSKAESKRLYHCSRPEAGASECEVLLEGEKMLREALQFPHLLQAVYATEPLEELVVPAGVKLYIVTQREAKTFSNLEQFPGVACRVKLSYAGEVGRDECAVYLHGIKDPGNAGAIIRSADWFGVPKVVTHESVSLFNPKLVQSSMGSVLRVGVVKLSSLDLLTETHHFYISDLIGTAAEDVVVRFPWVLCIGNESRGMEGLELSKATRVTIPRVGQHVDSLNAAVSCAILLDRFRTAQVQK